MSAGSEGSCWSASSYSSGDCRSTGLLITDARAEPFVALTRSVGRPVRCVQAFVPDIDKNGMSEII